MSTIAPPDRLKKGGVSLNRIGVAIVAAIVVGAIYAYLSFHVTDALDYKGQAALVAVSTFSFITSAFLLFDLTTLSSDDLGKISNERASLVIGLIFVCIYVPISIGTTFLDVIKYKQAKISDQSVVAGQLGNGELSNFHQKR